MLAVVSHLNGTGVGTFSNVDPSAFQPQVVDRIASAFWFISLALSLGVALFAILIKQWLREYMRWTEAHGQDAIRIRQIRREELKDWSIKDKIIVILPVTLQASVILFLTGLIFFLFHIDRRC